jgi:NTP pyrophosphatase (non-canonical NTP hydrolase)
VSLNDLADRCYAASIANGWYDDMNHRTFGDEIALMHTELSEAFEEYRDGQALAVTYYDPDDDRTPPKPLGIPSELADVIIRVLDTCAAKGIDIQAAVEEKLAYNATRGYRHGGKVL